MSFLTRQMLAQQQQSAQQQARAQHGCIVIKIFLCSLRAPYK